MIIQQKRSKMNPMLVKVLVVSAAIHILGLFILGGITVVKYIIPDEAQFEEPPEVNEEKPPPEVKIEIKPKPQIEPMRDLRMKKIGNIAVADIAVDLPSDGDSFTINAGIGGFGGASSLLGSGRGQLNFGSSRVNVFGIKTQAERILFVIDTSSDMLADEKGGITSYAIIKDEIAKLIGGLNAGTLFNVMLQDRFKTLLFKPRLVNASSNSHQQLIRWLKPINSNARYSGLDNIMDAAKPTLSKLTEDPIHSNLSLNWKGNETVFITQYALEQGIDTIFFITCTHGGFSTVMRMPTGKEAEAWDQTVNSPKYQEQLRKHEAEIPEMRNRIQSKLRSVNAQRKNKGQPPLVLDSRWGLQSQAKQLGLKWKTEHPGYGPRYEINPKDIEAYYNKLNEEIYAQFDRPSPSINIVLYLAEDEIFSKEEEKNIRDFVRFFDGKHRIVRGEKGIKSARIPEDAVN